MSDEQTDKKERCEKPLTNLHEREREREGEKEIENGRRKGGASFCRSRAGGFDERLGLK
jgi:hypothetical protein